MKQKDIALLLVIIFMSTVVAFGASKVLFKSDVRDQQAEKVDAITADFPQPDPRYFNDSAVNPTRLIEVSGSDNQNPFTGNQQ